MGKTAFCHDKRGQKCITRKGGSMPEARSERPVRSRGATIALVVAILLLNVFTYVLHIARYYGDSMEPSLHSGQTLVIYRTGKVSAGDVIAFYYNNKLLVRRVICMGGSQITVEKDGSVLIDEQLLDEPYLAEKSIGQCDLTFPYYVQPGNVFVMGDARAVSMDSRLTEIGTIPTGRILGKVLFVN